MRNIVEMFAAVANGELYMYREPVTSYFMRLYVDGVRVSQYPIGYTIKRESNNLYATDVDFKYKAIRSDSQPMYIKTIKCGVYYPPDMELSINGTPYKIYKFDEPTSYERGDRVYYVNAYMKCIDKTKVPEFEERDIFLERHIVDCINLIMTKIEDIKTALPECTNLKSLVEILNEKSDQLIDIFGDKGFVEIIKDDPDKLLSIINANR